jgi:hypothetical protein
VPDASKVSLVKVIRGHVSIDSIAAGAPRNAGFAGLAEKTINLMALG